MAENWQLGSHRRSFHQLVYLYDIMDVPGLEPFCSGAGEFDGKRGGFHFYVKSSRVHKQERRWKNDLFELSGEGNLISEGRLLPGRHRKKCSVSTNNKVVVSSANSSPTNSHYSSWSPQFLHRPGGGNERGWWVGEQKKPNRTNYLRGEIMTEAIIRKGWKRWGEPSFRLERTNECGWK